MPPTLAHGDGGNMPPGYKLLLASKSNARFTQAQTLLCPPTLTPPILGISRTNLFQSMVGISSKGVQPETKDTQRMTPQCNAVLKAQVFNLGLMTTALVVTKRWVGAGESALNTCTRMHKRCVDMFKGVCLFTYIRGGCTTLYRGCGDMYKGAHPCAYQYSASTPTYNYYGDIYKGANPCTCHGGGYTPLYKFCRDMQNGGTLVHITARGVHPFTSAP